MIAIIAPIWNFRLPAIAEGWIDKVLAPPGHLLLRNYLEIMVTQLVSLKEKKAIIFFVLMDHSQFAIRTFFLNMPTKRLKRGVFNLCGITLTLPIRDFFSVPFVDQKRLNFLEIVKKLFKKYEKIY